MLSAPPCPFFPLWELANYGDRLPRRTSSMGCCLKRKDCVGVPRCLFRPARPLRLLTPLAVGATRTYRLDGQQSPQGPSFIPRALESLGHAASRRQLSHLRLARDRQEGEGGGHFPPLRTTFAAYPAIQTSTNLDQTAQRCTSVLCIWGQVPPRQTAIAMANHYAVSPLPSSAVAAHGTAADVARSS